MGLAQVLVGLVGDRLDLERRVVDREVLAGALAELVEDPADTDRLYLALRALYEARSSGRTLTSADADRALFVRYADAYAAAKGPQLALVEQWRKVIEK